MRKGGKIYWCQCATVNATAIAHNSNIKNTGIACRECGYSIIEEDMKDPIYGNVVPGTEYLYQKYFEEILGKIDTKNFTSQTLGQAFDKGKIESDYQIVEEVANRAQEKENLSPSILQVMLEQYFWADPYKREDDKSRWIHRVRERKDEDYFPDSLVVYKRMFE